MPLPYFDPIYCFPPFKAPDLSTFGSPEAKAAFYAADRPLSTTDWIDLRGAYFLSFSWSAPSV